MVDAARKFRQMTGRHARKEMMLNVQEHIESEKVLQAAMQRSGEMMGPVAMVMYRPHREKGSHALTDQHRADVVPQDIAV